MSTAAAALIFVVEYAACFAENMIALMFAADMTDTRERRIPLCVGVSAVLAACVFMMNRTDLFSFYTTIFGIISLTLIIHQIYKASVTDSLIVTGAFMLILHMTDFILISCIGALSGDYDFGSYITETYSYARCIYIIIAKMTLAVVWIFLSKKTAAVSVHQRKLGVGLFLAVGLIYSLEKNIYDSFDPHIFVSGILIFVVVGLVVYCCYQYGKLKDKRMEMELLTERNRIMLRGLDGIEERSKREAVYYHDINNRLAILKADILEKKYEEAEKYIEKLLEEKSGTGINPYTGLKALDFLITEKKEEAEKLRTSFEVRAEKITLDREMEEDICVLTANMLDNAIECRKREGYIDGSIRLDISRAGGDMLYIKTVNTCKKCSEMKDGMPLSSKADTNLHGWGIRSMLMTVEKYDGNLSFKHEDGVFTAEAMFFSV